MSIQSAGHIVRAAVEVACKLGHLGERADNGLVHLRRGAGGKDQLALFREGGGIPEFGNKRSYDGFGIYDGKIGRAHV